MKINNNMETKQQLKKELESSRKYIIRQKREIALLNKALREIESKKGKNFKEIMDEVRPYMQKPVFAKPMKVIWGRTDDLLEEGLRKKFKLRHYPK